MLLLGKCSSGPRKVRWGDQLWGLLPAAYCLFWLLRHHLAAQNWLPPKLVPCGKLLKIGARIRETRRRLWVHLASGYPYRDLLAGLLQNLRASCII